VTLAQAADPGTVELLIAYTAVIITIVGGVLVFLLYHFFPLKRDVEAMKDDLYNGGEAGHIRESQEAREEIRGDIQQMRGEVRESHEQVRMRLDDLVLYVDDLGTWMAESEDLDDPPEYPGRRRARFSGRGPRDAGSDDDDGGGFGGRGWGAHDDDDD